MDKFNQIVKNLNYLISLLIEDKKYNTKDFDVRNEFIDDLKNILSLKENKDEKQLCLSIQKLINHYEYGIKLSKENNENESKFDKEWWRDFLIKVEFVYESLKAILNGKFITKSNSDYYYLDPCGNKIYANGNERYFHERKEEFQSWD
jgi:hypothetical protein